MMKPACNSRAERKPEEQVTQPFFILSWAPRTGPKPAAASPRRLTSPPSNFLRRWLMVLVEVPRRLPLARVEPKQKAFRQAKSACRGVQTRKKTSSSERKAVMPGEGRQGQGQMRVMPTDVHCTSSQTGGLALHTASPFCSYLLQKTTDLPGYLYPKLGFRSY